MNTTPSNTEFENRSVYRRIGERLRELRQANGQTQAEIAQVIQVSPQQYQKYEDAQSRCSLPYLMALAEHFDVHLNDILRVENQSPEKPKKPSDTIATEADLLARLVSAFVKLSDADEKLRLVQLVEAIIAAQENASKE